MKLTEFIAVDNFGNKYSVFINPEYIESVCMVVDKDRTGIGLVSGSSVEVNHTLKEVIEKLGINVESKDYKRTDQSH